MSTRLPESDGVATLRAIDGMRLRPDDWATVRFGAGETVFDMVKAIDAWQPG